VGVSTPPDIGTHESTTTAATTTTTTTPGGGNGGTTVDPNDPGGDGGDGMSGGGIAAIVIVTLLLVGGAGAGFLIYRKKDLIRMRQFSYGRQRENNSEGGIVNEVYGAYINISPPARPIYKFMCCRQ
jgi:hypothetical protein